MKPIRSISSPARSLLGGCVLMVVASSTFAASTWTNMGVTCTPHATGVAVKSTLTGDNDVYVGNVGDCGASGGIGLAADAFSTATVDATGKVISGTVFAKAEIYKFGDIDGIGVVSQYENPTKIAPSSVDNSFGTDAIRLTFNTAMTLSSITVGWNGSDGGVNKDSDLSVLAWTGDPKDLGGVDGKSLPGTLISSGWTLVGNYGTVGAATNNTATISTTISSSYWLVSAWNTSFGTISANGGALGGKADYFKLYGIGADGTTQQSRLAGATNQAPEPGSLALMGAALAGMIVIRRRKEQAS